MKFHGAKVNCDGLTLVEALLVIIFIVLMAMFLLPRNNLHNRARAVVCMSNQRQIAVGLYLWKDDNAGKYPWQLSETKDPVMEASMLGDAAADFSPLQAYIKQPWAFICPTDPVKTAPTNQTTFGNQNLSYFVGFDGVTNTAEFILSGDRHLRASETPVKAGLFTYTNGVMMGWTPELHSTINPAGVVSFYDGHVEMLRGTSINSAFQRQGLSRARYAVP